MISLVAEDLCPACNRPNDSRIALLCPSCLALLPRTNFHRIPVNSITAIFDNYPFKFGMCGAWFHYNPDAPEARLIRQAKYNGRRQLCRDAAEFYAREILIDKPTAFDGIDIILPIPMHWTKRLRRGYNQTHYIAEGISRVTGIPVAYNLKAIRPHTTQTRKSHLQRRDNIIGTMTVAHPEQLTGLNILIVDDVITTGSTLLEAVINLDSVRPQSISILALATAIR